MRWSCRSTAALAGVASGEINNAPLILSLLWLEREPGAAGGGVELRERDPAVRCRRSDGVAVDAGRALGELAATPRAAERGEWA